MAEPEIMADVPIASSDYVGRGIRIRLNPEGMRRSRLDAGIVKLTDRHASSSQPQQVYGNVTDIKHSTDTGLYLARMEIPATNSNADWREDVAAGMRGKSFSVGAEMFELREKGVSPEGDYLLDAVDWEPYEVMDAPAPMDARAVRTSDTTMTIGNLTIRGLSTMIDTVIERSLGQDNTEGGEAVEPKEQAVSLDTGRTEAMLRSMEERLTAFEKAEEARIAEATRLQRAADYGDMVAAAKRAGMAEEAAIEEVKRAQADGEGRDTFIARQYRTVLDSTQFQPNPLPTIKRAGAREIQLGNYMAIGMQRNLGERRGLLERDYTQEIEVLEIARSASYSTNSNSVPVPPALLFDGRQRQEFVQRVIGSTGLAGVEELYVDRENMMAYFTSTAPFLQWVTMRPGITDSTFQVPKGGTAPSSAMTAETTGTNKIAESSPTLTGSALSPEVAASFFRITDHGDLVTRAGMDVYWQMQFNDFTREVFATQLLRGSGTAPQIQGLWGMTGLHNINKGNSTTMAYSSVNDAVSRLRSQKATGMNLGWVLGTDLAALMESNLVATNFQSHIATRENLQGGMVYASGPYFVEPLLDGTAENDEGLFGFWDRMIVPIWGTQFELVQDRLADELTRRYSIRLYFNMDVSNLGAFLRMKRT